MGNNSYSNFSFIFLAIVFLLTACYKEVEVPIDYSTPENLDITFNDQPVAYDSVQKILLFSIKQPFISDFQILIESKAFTIIKIDNKYVDNQNSYHFNNVSTSEEYLVQLKYFDGALDYYSLQFTTLPIVQIFTNEDIPNDRKINAQVVITNSASNDEVIQSYAGIEIRGQTTSYNPKKSYSIEFLGDSLYSVQRLVSFFGLTADDDWILDAMYKDKVRMRKDISFKLWRAMQSENAARLNVNKPGVEGGFVEVFHNRQLLGLYNLSERVDRKRLGIQSSEESLEGLLFKSITWTGPTMYTSMGERYSEFIWEGWELIYPESLIIDPWSPFQDYIDFVVNSEDQNFSDSIFAYLDFSNSADYYIFMNVTSAIDNSGKNLFMARYNSQSPFFVVPWDLDATFGRTWHGDPVRYDSIMTNGLYNRLIHLKANDYPNQLTERWDNLRTDIITETYMLSLINEVYGEILASGAYDREIEQWPQYEININEEIEYIRNWTSNRLLFLDEYFGKLD